MQHQVRLPKINFKKLLLIFFICLSGYFFIFNAIVNYFSTKSKVSQLEKKLEKLEQQNRELKETLFLLKTDTNTIEYYIRKEFGYIKPEEKIYLLKKKE